MGEVVKVEAEPDSMDWVARELYRFRHPARVGKVDFGDLDVNTQAAYRAEAAVIVALLVADKDARIAELERRLNKALDLAIDTVGLANALARQVVQK